MPRYFIEVAYNGARYSGFQIQQNANSVQAEVEKALKIYYRHDFSLTGSSRTDAGVHAKQNFFHFDSELPLSDSSYHLNAILPPDIVIKKLYAVADDIHCRFSALSRQYCYYVYQKKNPFINDRAYYYPFPLNIDLLQEAASVLYKYTDFTSFSKRNTQTKTKLCTVIKSEWMLENDVLLYNVEANRFLRGMVRGLVGTMLLVGRGKISVDDFNQVIKAENCAKADFSAPAHGLFLEKVSFR